MSMSIMCGYISSNFVTAYKRALIGFCRNAVTRDMLTIKDNLPAAKTWQRYMPPLHIIIKYQQKSQMKCVSHKFN